MAGVSGNWVNSCRRIAGSNSSTREPCGAREYLGGTSAANALTDGSAQSAERVQTLAQALGVTDATLRKRIAPTAKTPTTLQAAFLARHEIAHELDVTDPDAKVRKPLEKIRRYRSQTAIQGWCVELLDVTQLITDDVARRLSG